MKMLEKKNINIQIYLSLIVISLAISIYTQWPALSSPYVINDDVRQLIYWMGRFHDPQLFNNDIYVQFSSYVTPLGFKWLYYVLTFFMDPVFTGKLLSIFLFVLSAIFLYKLGEVIQSRYTGIFLFLLFCCYPVHIERFAGGLERAFAFPLLILFLFYLQQFKIKECAFTLALQILFYPAIFLISFFCLIFTLLFTPKKASEYFNDKKSIMRILLPIIILCIFLIYKFISKPEFLGSLTDIQTILSNQSSMVYGRSPSLPVKSIFFVAQELLFSHKFFFFALPFYLMALIYDIFQKKSYSSHKYKITFFLLFSSILAYLLARSFLLKLYFPIKYVEYSLPLVSLIIIACAAGFIIRIINSRWMRVVFLVIFVFFAHLFYVDSIKPGIGCEIDQRRQVPLFTYIGALPKDSLILANPYLSDDVSCFSRKKVFVKYELSHPWFNDYAKIIQQRLIDFYLVYFSESGEEIYEFCKNNGIGFIIVDKTDFSEEDLNKLASYTESSSVKKGKAFFLLNIPKEKILFQTSDGRYFVIKPDTKTLSH